MENSFLWQLNLCFHTSIVALSQSQEMVLGKFILKETSMKYFFWDLGHWHPLVFPVSQMNVMVKKKKHAEINHP